MTDRQTKWTIDLSRPDVVWAAVGAVVCVVLVLVVRVLWVGQSTWFDRETRKKVRQIERQLETLGLEPTPQTVESLEQEQARLREIYTALVSVVDPPRPRGSRAEEEPGLYFREELHSMQKELGRQAFLRSLALPSEMGFSEDMPPPERVPVLLHSVELLKTVGQALLAEDVRAVELLTAREPTVVMRDEAGTPLLDAVPVQVRFQAPVRAVYRFLSAMAQSVPIAELTELRVRSGAPDDPVVQADIVVSSYAVMDRRGGDGAGGGE